ncbi:alcohol dehydrogenase catalytic domain-containing protein [Microbacterium paraoxydans]|uniref:alcohol dehydrogenase catalytic domain-containing protein n=1 Tax=Microbacterium paraoxydans TaxID=199592 RepID=UPI001CF9C502|nr:alcohol dehydrogenase catalytic domain-containing protein [Microbacterium paraoxydans]
MRAAVLSRHDLDGLSVADTAAPTPGAGDVLVRVDTVGVNQLDLNVIAGTGPGAQAQLPRILGIDPAGEIVGVGAEVDPTRIGQAVVVKPNIACGLCAHCQAGDEADCPRQTVVGVHRDGGAAEFVVVPARNAFDRRGLDAAQATAVVHSASIVINAVRTVGLTAGDRVLITGAGGTLGRAAVAVALARGADVVAASRRALTALGDEQVIQAADAPALASALSGGGGFDVVLDVSGHAPTLSAGISALQWGGRAVFCAASIDSDLHVDSRDFYLRRKRLFGVASARYDDVAEALALADIGVLPSLVGSRYALADIATAYRDFPRKGEGKVIVDVR